MTTRLDKQPNWSADPLVTTIVLNRLHHRQAAELIQTMARTQPISEETMLEIVRRSDGLPLFIEELTRSVVDDAQTAGTTAKPMERPIANVPTSLESLLAARLDRTGKARDVAQIASAIGREFPFSLLKAVAKTEPGPLLAALGEAVRPWTDHPARRRRGQLVRVPARADPGGPAYRTLIAPRRRELHLRIAEALDGPVNDPEQVALHYGWAGHHEKALILYRTAAQRARGRYALVERSQHLRKAVLHAQSLPGEADQPALELEVLIELGLALIDHRGSGHDEVGTTFERARSLCMALGHHHRMLTVMDALAVNHHFARSDSAQMLRYAAELDDVAGLEGLALAPLWAARMRSSACLLRGEFEAARMEFETVIARYGAMEQAATGAQTARDPRASTFGNLAICLTVQGQVTEAVAAQEDGMRHAERSKSVLSVMVSLRRACVQGMLVRDDARVARLAGRLIALNAAHETFTALREGTIAAGWATLRATGDAGSTLQAMLTSMDELEKAQHLVYLPFLMGAVAEQTWVAGRNDVARTLLERALTLLRRTGEVWCEAELIRLQALFSDRDRPERVKLLERSLGIARAQGAAWWELRTATDLAESWASTGSDREAALLLQTALPRFGDALALPDVARANAVLTGLAPQYEWAPRSG